MNVGTNFLSKRCDWWSRADSGLLNLTKPKLQTKIVQIGFDPARYLLGLAHAPDSVESVKNLGAGPRPDVHI